VQRRVLKALGIGAALLGAKLIMDRLGWSALRDALEATGPWFAVIAVIDTLAIACDAGAIWSLARPRGPIAYHRAFTAQITGYAINRVTPGSALGEPVKIAVLASEVGQPAAVSTIVLYNVVTIAVGAAAIAVGVPLALLALDLSSQMRLVVTVAGAVMVGVVTVLFGLVRRGLPRWVPRAAEINAHLVTFGDAATWRALGFATGSRILNWLGTLLVAHALGVPLTGPTVIAVMSFGVVISWVSNLSPLGLGIADGGSYELYGAFGATPEVGLAVAMVQRARTLSVIAFGLAVAAIGRVARSAPVRRIETVARESSM
jgi:lysylphosphatidylglycerol synthase-like protein